MKVKEAIKMIEELQRTKRDLELLRSFVIRHKDSSAVNVMETTAEMSDAAENVLTKAIKSITAQIEEKSRILYESEVTFS